MFSILSFIYKVFVFSYKKNSIRIAIRNGMEIGKGTKFVGLQNFGTEPFLIKIGTDCLITHGVQFLNHDGGIQVPLIKDGMSIDEVYGNYSKVGTIEIGSNVFVGVNSIILPATKIGDNSLVAAGSVVTGTFPSDVVIGGVPARIICSIDEYYNKNKERILYCDNKNSSKRKEIIFNSLN